MLPETTRMALIDMMYNLGKTRFLGFKRMIAAITAGDLHTASLEAIDSKWASQVGDRAVRDAELLKGGSNG